MSAVANKTAAKTRIAELSQRVHQADHQYYAQARPAISDEEYDMLMQELRELEAAFPELVLPTSPTQKLADVTSDGFAKVKHAHPMLSVDNAYGDDDFKTWVISTAARLGTIQGKHVVALAQPKVDGVAIELLYEDGKLKQALTRGDGAIGDDVTENVKQVLGVLHKLPKDLKLPEGTWIRGEIYVPLAAFKTINEGMDEGEQYANPRNLAAGTLKCHEPEKVKARGLAFAAHGVAGECPGVASLCGLLLQLGKAGMGVVSSRVVPFIEGPMLEAVGQVRDERDKFGFATDGCVVKLDLLDAQRSLGHSSKYVRWAIAYKFRAETAVTRLDHIDWQVGRTGQVTPRATLDPVALCGTTISAAGVHNPAQVTALGLYDGCQVTLHKAGEIIPQILSVKPPGEGETVSLGSCATPVNCPECKTKLAPSGPELFCPNKECSGRLQRLLEFFCSRGCMNIKGTGESRIAALIASGLVKSIPDLFNLVNVREEARKVLGDKVADKMIENLQACKFSGMAAVLRSMGWSSVGNKVSTVLAKHYPTIWEAIAAPRAELLALPELGEFVVDKFLERAGDRESVDVLKTLERVHGVSMESTTYKRAETPIAAVSPVSGKRVCVTGKFDLGGRSHVEAQLAAHGAVIESSLTKKTDLLLVGKDAGSKLDKAKERGIEQWSEADLMGRMGKTLQKGK